MLELDPWVALSDEISRSDEHTTRDSFANVHPPQEPGIGTRTVAEKPTCLHPVPGSERRLLGPAEPPRSPWQRPSRSCAHVRCGCQPVSCAPRRRSRLSAHADFFSPEAWPADKNGRGHVRPRFAAAMSSNKLLLRHTATCRRRPPTPITVSSSPQLIILRSLSCRGD
jgi:hypothetical protein